MNEIGDVSCQLPGMVLGRYTSSLGDICKNSADLCIFQHKFEKESLCIVTDNIMRVNFCETFTTLNFLIVQVCKGNPHYNFFDSVWSGSDCKGNITDGNKFELAYQPESWFSSYKCLNLKI